VSYSENPEGGDKYLLAQVCAGIHVDPLRLEKKIVGSSSSINKAETKKTIP